MVRAERYNENPLIRPQDLRPSRPDFEVLGVFNCAVTRFREEILLLMRVAERPVCDDPAIVRIPVLDWPESAIEPGVLPTIQIQEYRRDDPRLDLSDPRVVAFEDQIMLTSISHLRLARSKDGRRFSVEDAPALFPDRPSEAFGIEDPRITKIGDTYYITYKSVAATGITQTLASTTDFVHFEKRGLIFCPENMDVAIFPEKVDGRYVALHRPQPRMIGRPNMWVAYSEDLAYWGDHRYLMGTQPGSWDSGRIGAGAPPIKTEHGWLEIYHGATPDDIYCLGAALLDLEHPHRVIARSREPIMSPEAPYELEGLMPNVVFTCGLAQEADRLSVYYGAADKVIAAADISLSDLLAALGV